DSGHSILASGGFLQRAHARQILKSDDEAAGFTGLSEQRRDRKAEAQSQTVWRQTISLKARAQLSGGRGRHGIGNLPFHVAEENRDVMTSNFGRLVSGDLFGGGIKGIDTAFEVSRDHTRSNRFDDPFMQRAQVGQ